MPFSTLLLFLSAAVALTLAPGPDNLFILAQGVARGRRAALATAWGMCSGVSVHTLLAALGVSAAISASAWAFAALKYAGAGYLLFLAWKALREKAVRLPDGTVEFLPPGALFRRGFLMNVINPKVCLFFLALLPQFAVPGTSWPVPVQMAVLGGVFMAQGFVVFSAIAWLSGGIGHALLRRPGIAKGLTRLTAAVFVALGLRMLW